MIYKTIKKKAVVEQTIKKSKFIGIAMPSSSKEEALAFIEGLKSEYKDASHIVYAYRFGPEKEEFYFTDNGEPSGSAGKPVFTAITGADVFNCVVAVVRYFGGIKLGVGGLIRAYFSTAKAAIESAEIIEVTPTKILAMEFPYEASRLVMYYVHEFSAEVVETHYEEVVKMKLRISEDRYQEFMNVLSKKSHLVRFS